MKKLLAVLFISAISLVGCKNKDGENYKQISYQEFNQRVMPLAMQAEQDFDELYKVTATRKIDRASLKRDYTLNLDENYFYTRSDDVDPEYTSSFRTLYFLDTDLGNQLYFVDAEQPSNHHHQTGEYALNEYTGKLNSTRSELKSTVWAVVTLISQYFIPDMDNAKYYVGKTTFKVVGNGFEAGEKFTFIYNKANFYPKKITFNHFVADEKCKTVLTYDFDLTFPYYMPDDIGYPLD